MEITIDSKPLNGKICVTVKYYEQIDGLGYSGEVEVWVNDVDSRAQLKAAALHEAQNFLKRALSAHSD